jgi:hypothetical protein
MILSKYLTCTLFVESTSGTNDKISKTFSQKWWEKNGGLVSNAIWAEKDH